jgi:hypothetical protein
MHKTSSGAAATGGSNTTAGVYQKRDFTNMRTAANQIATWFAQQVGAASAQAAPAPAGMTPDRLASLQALADIPEKQLAKLLKLAEVLK